jgi:hypothetical protein
MIGQQLLLLMIYWGSPHLLQWRQPPTWQSGVAVRDRIQDKVRGRHKDAKTRAFSTVSILLRNSVEQSRKKRLSKMLLYLFPFGPKVRSKAWSSSVISAKQRDVPWTKAAHLYYGTLLSVYCFQQQQLQLPSPRTESIGRYFQSMQRFHNEVAATVRGCCCGCCCGYSERVLILALDDAQDVREILSLRARRYRSTVPLLLLLLVLQEERAKFAQEEPHTSGAPLIYLPEFSYSCNVVSDIGCFACSRTH